MGFDLCASPLTSAAVPSGADFSQQGWKGGALEAAEKRSNTGILSPFAVILSAAKNLALALRVNYAKDLALVIFNAMRDSSSPGAPQNDSACEVSRSLFSPAVKSPFRFFSGPAPGAVRGRKLRRARGEEGVEAAILAGLKPRPSASPLTLSKWGEKYRLLSPTEAFESSSAYPGRPSGTWMQELYPESFHRLLPDRAAAGDRVRISYC